MGVAGVEGDGDGHGPRQVHRKLRGHHQQGRPVLDAGQTPFRVQGSGCRVQGAGCMVQGQGSGCRVQASGFIESSEDITNKAVSYWTQVKTSISSVLSSQA